MRGGADELLLLMERQAISYLDTPVGKQKLIPILNWAENITTGSTGDLKPVAKRAIANSNAYANSYANANAIANSYANAYANAIAYANSYANAIAYAYAITYAIANANANANANAYAYAIAYAIAYANANAYANAYAIDQILRYIEELDKLSEVFKDINPTQLIAQLKTLKTEIPDDNQPKEIRQEFGLKIIRTLQSAFHITPELINLSINEVMEIDKNYFYIYNLMLKCKTAALTLEEQTWSEIEERMLLAPQKQKLLN